MSNIQSKSMHNKVTKTKVATKEEVKQATSKAIEKYRKALKALASR